MEELRHSLFSGQQPHSAVVQSEKRHGYGLGFLHRLFVETPDQLLPDTVLRYWPEAIPGWPLEGYSLPSGQIDLLRRWDQSPRDDHLFREMMNHVFVAFYTHPSEHRHLAFVTCKLDLDDMKQLLDIDALASMAQELCGH